MWLSKHETVASWVIYHNGEWPRKLKRLISSHMDANLIMEEQKIVPGGHLRTRGNKWLRDAFEESDIPRIPRRPEVEKVIKVLDHKHKFSSMALMGQHTF